MPRLPLDEMFAAGDDRFLEALIQVDAPDLLLEVLSHWLVDERPWARQQVVSYLDIELNFPGHEVVVKRLFRHFETARDHSLMAHFMVAFDRCVRRGRTVLLPDLGHGTGRRLFGYRTRNHLRRRVWRYFRRLSYFDPVAYLKAVSEALVLYRGDDVSTDARLLDNWSLMHACSFGSEGLTFNAAHANCKLEATLTQPAVAPYQPDLWQCPEAAELLIQIILLAKCSWCRLWAKALLLREHSEVIGRIIECESCRTGRRHSNPQTAAETWCSDLSGIHQRGRAKLVAMTAIRTAILEQPARSAGLLPLLAAAVRSSSAAERRHALAAVTTLMVERPQLRVEIAGSLPELEWCNLAGESSPEARGRSSIVSAEAPSDS